MAASVSRGQTGNHQDIDVRIVGARIAGVAMVAIDYLHSNLREGIAPAALVVVQRAADIDAASPQEKSREGIVDATAVAGAMADPQKMVHRDVDDDLGVQENWGSILPLRDGNLAWA